MRKVLIVLLIMAVTGVTAPEILVWLAQVALKILEFLRPLAPSIVGPIEQTIRSFL